MYKKYFGTFLLLASTAIAAYAGDPVFSNSDTEQFNLQPLNVETKSPVATKGSSKNAVQVKAYDSKMSDQSFLKAIGSLDAAQVDLREQLQNYGNLVLQSRTTYLGDKAEYKAYKKQYNALKKKINKIEKTKKSIQKSIVDQTTVAN